MPLITEEVKRILLAWIEETAARNFEYYQVKGWMIFPPMLIRENGVLTENFKNGAEFGKFFARGIEMKLENYLTQ